MADIPKPLDSIPEVKPRAAVMSFNQEEETKGKTAAKDSFVALDVGTLSLLVACDKDSTQSPRLPLKKTLSWKGSQRVEMSDGRYEEAAEGDTTYPSPGSLKKPALLVHVAGEADAFRPPHAPTPISTGTGGRCRRVGRRPSPWLHPRMVLLFFATLSSMGTLILLYCMLSMGKMADSDANAP